MRILGVIVILKSKVFKYATEITIEMTDKWVTSFTINEIKIK